MNRSVWGPRLLTAWSLATYALLFSPALVIALFSFNAPQGRFNLLWHGFTLANWRQPLSDGALSQAFLHSLLLALAAAVLATLLALPLALAVSDWPQTSWSGWAVVVYLGVAATGVAYLLFTHALQRISATTAVSMCLVEPLTAFVLAILVIGERPPAAAFGGLVLVMLGLGMVVRAELRPAPR